MLVAADFALTALDADNATPFIALCML